LNDTTNFEKILYICGWKSKRIMTHRENFSKGLMKENPVFVLVLGMCPTLATTTSAINGLGMGLATTFVLMLSNVAISLIAGLIPDKVRIPAYIVVIASFVTVVDMLMAAYVNSPGPNGEPSLYDQLGIFIPLIVVNCIVLGRAEAFAAKNKAFASLLDGAGIGLGFAFALTLLGSVREMLGSGSVFGLQLLPQTVQILIFVLAPGAFIALGYLIAAVNKLKKANQ
jgi:electron transport complex protein RnfE